MPNLISIVRLAQGRLSLSSLSGPIKIYEVAGQEGRKGPDYFIWVMALISINLGLLNLLPIPVLDGGHFMFLCWEGIRGKPPSDWVIVTATLLWYSTASW